MRRTRFDEWPCPIARTTDLIGDWWTPLVMREAFLGARRSLIDRDTGDVVDPLIVDDHTGVRLDVRRLLLVPRGDQSDPVATSRSASVDQPDHDPM